VQLFMEKGSIFLQTIFSAFMTVPIGLCLSNKQITTWCLSWEKLNLLFKNWRYSWRLIH